MKIFSPEGLESYTAYFNSILSISGVLFALAFAMLIFIIQSGFSSFKYSRRMFLELYVHFGRSLLMSLAYLTIMPLLVLYANKYWWLINITYIWFCIFYLKAILGYQYHLGYLATINSTKFVPQHYGKLRAYVRSITNLGFIHNFVTFSLAAIMLVYPIIISFVETKMISITEKGVFYSTLMVIVLTVLKIKNFIPEFFEISNQELDYKELKTNEASNVDCKIEFEAFEKHLISHQIKELNPSEERQFLDGTLWLQFLKDREGAELWFNVNIKVNDVTNLEVRDEVCKYASKILSLFVRSKVDINQIVMSFHIKIEDDSKYSRNIFIRTTRLELEKVDFEAGNPVQEICKLESVNFDSLFRNI